jgi:PII-like signaling protein
MTLQVNAEGSARMLSKGAAKKVTIYVNEDTQERFSSIYEKILEYLMHKGIAGATATRAAAGFGSHRVLHTPRVEALSEHLPIRIEFIDTAEKVDELLPTLYEMVTDGLIEVQDTTVVKVATKERGKTQPKQPHQRLAGKAKMMRIFLGEADRWNGEPLYDAIVKQFRMMDIAGATVYRGILGYGAKGHTRKQNLLHTSRDLPVMITVVETEEKLGHASKIAEEMLQDGLIVVSDVDMVRLIHSHSLAEATEGSDAKLPAS